MSYNIEEMERRLNKCQNELDGQEGKLKEIILNSLEKDETNQNIYLLNDIMNEDEKQYYKVNKAYKKYISQYSKEYIEMSEYYYGPELPYDVYCKEFKEFNNIGTYLDSGKDIKELYSLFIFFAMYNYSLSETTVENMEINKYIETLIN